MVNVQLIKSNFGDQTLGFVGIEHHHCKVHVRIDIEQPLC